MRFIDLTQPITNKMLVYPGDKPPTLYQTDYIQKNTYTNFELTTGMHVGTHIDGPSHMIDKTPTIDEIPLEYFVGKACIIDIQNEKEFSDVQKVRKISAGCSILLFHTGRGDQFSTESYFSNYPTISKEVAECISNLAVKMIGIDSCSPDKAPYEVHKILFNKGILIAENLMNLHLLLNEDLFNIVALPLKVATDSAPARVIAIIYE